MPLEFSQIAPSDVAFKADLNADLLDPMRENFDWLYQHALKAVDVTGADYQAADDGLTNVTGALNAAASDHRAIYLPFKDTGVYMVDGGFDIETPCTLICDPGVTLRLVAENAGGRVLSISSSNVAVLGWPTIDGNRAAQVNDNERSLVGFTVPEEGLSNIHLRIGRLTSSRGYGCYLHTVNDVSDISMYVGQADDIKNGAAVLCLLHEDAILRRARIKVHNCNFSASASDSAWGAVISSPTESAGEIYDSAIHITAKLHPENSNQGGAAIDGLGARNTVIANVVGGALGARLARGQKAGYLYGHIEAALTSGLNLNGTQGCFVGGWVDGQGVTPNGVNCTSVSATDPVHYSVGNTVDVRVQDCTSINYNIQSTQRTTVRVNGRAEPGTATGVRVIGSEASFPLPDPSVHITGILDGAALVTHERVNGLTFNGTIKNCPTQPVQLVTTTPGVNDIVIDGNFRENGQSYQLIDNTGNGTGFGAHIRMKGIFTFGLDQYTADVWNARDNIGLFTGLGSPNNIAGPGSRYVKENGLPGEQIWIKTTPGNTVAGWVRDGALLGSMVVPLTALRQNAARKDPLPDTPAGNGGAMGLPDAAGSMVVTSTSNGNSITEYAAFRLPLPANYHLSTPIKLRAIACQHGIRAVGAHLVPTVKWVDAVNQVQGDNLVDVTGGIPPLPVDSHQAIDYTIVPTGLNAGDLLDVVLAVIQDDTGGSTNGHASIARIEFIFG